MTNENCQAIPLTCSMGPHITNRVKRTLLMSYASYVTGIGGTKTSSYIATMQNSLKFYKKNRSLFISPNFQKYVFNLELSILSLSNFRFFV